MLSILPVLFLFGRVTTQCENSKAVVLGKMLQDVLDLNSTVLALLDIITNQVPINDSIIVLVCHPRHAKS